VAGVMIDGDRQFRLLSSYIQGLVEEYVPEDKRKGFCFHAKELANGGKTFVRGEYDDSRRLQALRKMASIPRRFLLPIVIGWHRKNAIPAEIAPKTAEKRAALAQAHAYTQCAIGADQFMQRFTKPDEVAICVAENNDSARRAVKGAHQFLYETPGAQIPFLADCLPISRIIDTVHFASKAEAVLLQIADVCAYVIARYINKAQGSDVLVDLMTGGQGIPRETFDPAGGYRIQLLYNASKVSAGQSWYASKLVRSSPGFGGLQIVKSRSS
jgi:hypothetical protein